ncbi:MAG: pilus assembly protein TadG-related protein [Pseudomonadota bacterium]
MTRIGRRIEFFREEAGAMTLWLLVWSFAFLGMAGLAVDVSNAYRHQSMLQATADAAAHAALVVLRDGGTEAEARAMAQRVARLNMDTTQHAEVVEVADITIGAWDGTHVIDSTDDNAVHVVARRDDTSQFPVGTLFLHFVGVRDIEVNADALMVMDYPNCPQDGVFARGTLSFTSQNRFGAGLCLHSQSEISVSGFEADPENPLMPDIGDGTAFSAPDTDEKPNGDFKSSNNARAEMEAADAIRRRNYDPAAASEENVRARINATRTEVEGIVEVVSVSTSLTNSNNSRASRDDEGDDTSAVCVNFGFLRVSNPPNKFDLQAKIDDCYRYFYLVCSRDDTITLDGDTDLTDVVLISDGCALKTTGSDSLFLFNTFIGVDKPGDASAISFKGKSINPGAVDCNGLGSITILTTGGMHFTAGTNFTKIELISTGDMKLTADAELTAGISMQSYGDIDFSAKANIQGCATAGPEDQTEFVRVLRLVL